MKKFQYIVVLLFVIVLGTGCSNDEKQENGSRKIRPGKNILSKL